MNLRKVCFLLPLLFLAGWLPLRATHIVGAELTYKCLNNNNYEITLTMYRDCLNGQAPFDDPITLFVFNHNSGLTVYNWQVSLPANTPEIEPENWNSCVGTPYNICVEIATYTTIQNLPPVNGGYDIAWARCCRNYAITNLASPGCEGVTFLAHVPGPDEAVGCNSMPTFNQYPPIFLCAGMPFYFNHSATDPDGDSLVYEISNPYTGLNTQNLGAAANNAGGCTGPALPPVVDAGNPMGPMPYQNVVYAPNHNYLNPFGIGQGSITIDPNTGFLTATPMNNGIYVLAISVKEYRAGVLLSENKRDFQFHVITCMQQSSPPILTHDLSGLNSSGDTIFAQAGVPFCYTFTVEDSIVPSTILVTPISTSFGGNGGFPPPYATLTLSGNTPPVFGTICWEPHCDYVGQTVECIISARDTNDCANYNVVFDTVWVTVLPSPSSPPVVTHDFGSLNTNGDTILVNVQTPFCYDFFIVDTIGSGSLQYTNILYDTIGVPANQVQTINTWTSGDTLYGTVCWNGYCNYGRTYLFVTTGIDENQCPPGNTSTDTVWIRILEPYNPAPVITTDLSGNVMNNDTIIARVHENTCFNFTVVDTAISSGTWDSLSFSYVMEEYPSGNPPGTNLPTYYATVSGDTLFGQICWTPRCPNVDQTYRVLLSGIQFNQCLISNSDHDTVYIHVIEPLKPPPAISHDLGSLSTDNVTLHLDDNESFCYDFLLEDSLMPTYLTYNAFVELVSGQVYTGPQPTVNFTSQLDSFVTGNICWEVPCEFANQAFRIVMEGRDTFDCHPGNIVYDTVLVFHTENLPNQIPMCRVTVLPGDVSVQIDWNPSSDPDADHYLIRRRRDDEATFTLVATVPGAGSITHQDQGIYADDHVYCYSVYAVDRCGNESLIADEACTILLEGIAEGYAAFLEWTAYLGWPGGVDQYEIQHRSHLQPAASFVTTGTVGPGTFTLAHSDIDYAITCYRVKATENGPGCGVESWSNEICLVFPSTLFLPNAFTPNGDGVNDVFFVPGEFLESFHLTIFNRWGQLIFETRDQNQGWDGTFRNAAVPEGSYVYRVEGTGYDKVHHQSLSTVTVIR